LLIPGGLTYNGEKISHEALVKILKKISKQDIKIFVIPNFRDIDNPSAKAYYGNGSTPTPSISAEEFEKLYQDFGYKDPIAKDPNSLSYLAQAFKGIWILGIDVDALTDQIKPETFEWISYWVAKAKEKNITLLPMCSRNITEQFVGEAIFGPAYIINNHTTAENELTDDGLRIIFTAQANDITMFSEGENILYDIATDMLLSPPFAYRMISLEQGFMNIETRYIKSINAAIPGGGDFLTYSNICLAQRLTKIFINILMNSYHLPLGDAVTPGTASYYAPHYARGLAAFYAGDEQFPPLEEEFSKDWPYPFGFALKTLYTDLPPTDGQYIIDMK